MVTPVEVSPSEAPSEAWWVRGAEVPEDVTEKGRDGAD
jgi:hypothetical protein